MSEHIEDKMSKFKSFFIASLNESLRESPDAWSFGVAYDPFVQQICDSVTLLVENAERSGAISEQEWFVREMRSLKPSDRVVGTLSAKCVERMAELAGLESRE